MNDRITLAASQDDDPRELPDTTGAPTPTSAEPIRTLLETAGTCRPLEEVAERVSLLKDEGRGPNPGHQALRAAAVGRPIRDVALLVGILGTDEDEDDGPAAPGRTARPAESAVPPRPTEMPRPSETAQPSETAEPARTAGPTTAGPTTTTAPPAPAGPTWAVRSAPVAPPVRPVRSAHPAGERPAAPRARHEPPYEDPDSYDEPYDEPYESPNRYRRPYGRTAKGVPDPGARSGALRHVLRWPVVAALLVCGVLHLPSDVSALPSQPPIAFLPLLATVLCLGLGALLAVRDTPGAWRAGAVAAVGVVTLHVVGGVAGFDPLEGAVSASLAWAGATAVLCAAAAAVLAGMALVNRSPQARAGADG